MGSLETQVLCQSPLTSDAGSHRVKGPRVLLWNDLCLCPEVLGGAFSMLNEHMSLFLHKDAGSF